MSFIRHRRATSPNKFEYRNVYSTNRIDVAFSRMIYQDAHWNMKRSYRLDGKLFPEQNLVSFPILDAIPIENGKILEAAVSPTVAPRQAEASPSQNNPSSAVKANRGAV